MDYSSTWIQDIQVHFTMLPSCVNLSCTRIIVNSLYTYEYFECLLGNLNYLGEEMFIMCWLGRCKLALKHDLDAVNAFDKMHVGYKIKVEWGIGGFKRT
jgi:hypothetical protein